MQAVGAVALLKKMALSGLAGGVLEKDSLKSFGLVSGLVEVIFREWVTPQLGPKCK